jgi:hypothetical protein
VWTVRSNVQAADKIVHLFFCFLFFFEDHQTIPFISITSTYCILDLRAFSSHNRGEREVSSESVHSQMV